MKYKQDLTSKKDEIKYISSKFRDCTIADFKDKNFTFPNAAAKDYISGRICPDISGISSLFVKNNY